MWRRLNETSEPETQAGSMPDRSAVTKRQQAEEVGIAWLVFRRYAI
jgi:hypothetical protein